MQFALRSSIGCSTFVRFDCVLVRSLTVSALPSSNPRFSALSGRNGRLCARTKLDWVRIVEKSSDLLFLIFSYLSMARHQSAGELCHGASSRSPKRLGFYVASRKLLCPRGSSNDRVYSAGLPPTRCVFNSESIRSSGCTSHR